MCRTLLQSGEVPGFHMYTLNLETATIQVLKNLGTDKNFRGRVPERS